MGMKNRFKELAGNEASDTGLLICNVEKKMNMPGNDIAIPRSLFPAWPAKLISLS
jgi:hypothetical protein